MNPAPPVTIAQSVMAQDSIVPEILMLMRPRYGLDGSAVPDACARRAGYCQTRTQSTSICAGKWVEAFGEPGHSPPTARSSSRK